MSIEGNVLANTLANSAAENAYQNTQTTRDTLSTSTIEDAETFAGLTNSPTENALAPGGISPTQTDVPSTPGDEILKSIQKISDAQAASVRNLVSLSEQLKKSETISMAGALEMQRGLMEFQLKQEIISKATGSINQGVQTLFKNQ